MLEISFSVPPILEKIEFSADGNGITGIIGPNGAGKSTLLKAIAGLIRFDGKILWNNHDTGRISPSDRARIFSYIPQSFEINYDISVNEFLLFSRYAWDESISMSKVKVRQALEKTKMSEFSERNCRTLSGGEMQKIMLCSALVQDSPVWLLDEPTSFLDPGSESAFFQMLSEIIRQRCTTLLCVSHNLSKIFNVSSALILMKNGKILGKGTPDEIISGKTLEELYNVDFLVKNRQYGIVAR